MEELWRGRGEGTDGELFFCLSMWLGVRDLVWESIGVGCLSWASSGVMRYAKSGNVSWEGYVHGGSVRKRCWSCGEGREKQEVLVHYYIEGFGHGWPNTVEQDDDYQRYGPVSW